MGSRGVALSVALMFLTIAAAPRTAKPDSPSDDTTVLKELACTAGRAYAERDLPTLERLSADDYAQTDVRGGVLHRAEWLDFVRNRKSELEVECDSVEVRIYGDSAVVIGGWTYTRKSAPGSPGIHSRWSSFWTKSGDIWKRHAFQNTYVNPNADKCAMEEARP